MTGSTVLIAGVTRFVASSVAGRLMNDPHVARVIGVDAALPDAPTRARMSGAEFIRVDIRTPQIARVIEQNEVDTVVHASATSAPANSAGKTLTKEMNVLGTMQLLAACQRSPAVRRVVIRSTAAVYGGSPRDPAVFTEQMQARAIPNSGPGRDAIEIEGYVRAFARRRPDVRVAMPRFAEIIGPNVRTPLTRYFALSPAVPVLWGRDARLQLVHEQDAIEVLSTLAVNDWTGVVNVAGAGTLTVSQAIRRAGRIPVSMPGISLGLLGRGLRAARLGGFAPEQVTLLADGRSLDTTVLRRDLGIDLRYSTHEAFADFAAALANHPAAALRAAVLGRST